MSRPKSKVGEAVAFDAILGDELARSLASQNETRSVSTLPRTALVPSPLQPRQHFGEGDLEELAASLRQHGMLEPLLVRPLGEDRYEIVFGERRWRAAERAGLGEVPVVVREVADEAVLELAIVENLQRRDLNPVEETEGILRLLEQRLGQSRDQVIALLHHIHDVGRGRVSHNVMRTEQIGIVEAVFAAVGRLTAQSFRANRLPLLGLPAEVLDAVRVGRIAYTIGVAIGKVRDPEAREKLLAETIEKRLSLTEVRARVQALLPARPRIETLAGRCRHLAGRLDSKYLAAVDASTRRRVERLLAEHEHLVRPESRSGGKT